MNIESTMACPRYCLKREVKWLKEKKKTSLIANLIGDSWLSFSSLSVKRRTYRIFDALSMMLHAMIKAIQTALVWRKKMERIDGITLKTNLSLSIANFVNRTNRRDPVSV
jgi:hypothetical protein